MNGLMLPSGYSARLGSADRAEWEKLLRQFDDATIYQTWSYGAVRWGEPNLSHLILEKEGIIVGLAQATIRRLPWLKAGFAYIPWGPVWRKTGEEQEDEHLRNLLRALKQEYSGRRGLLLRLAPNEAEAHNSSIRPLLEGEGFVLFARPYRTLLIDLSTSLDELHKKVSRRWRRALKAAQTKGLEIIEGTSDDMFNVLVALHRKMVARKKFRPGIDIGEFQAIQKDLPDQDKMKIMICLQQGEPISALCASLLGRKAVALVGGTTSQGLNSGSFHLLNWRMIERMQQAGARYYDFGGYDPEENPGTASFKDGLPGEDVMHVGHFEVCQNPLSRFIVTSREFFLKILQRLPMR